MPFDSGILSDMWPLFQWSYPLYFWCTFNLFIAWMKVNRNFITYPTYLYLKSLLWIQSFFLIIPLESDIFSYMWPLFQWKNHLYFWGAFILFYIYVRFFFVGNCCSCFVLLVIFCHFCWKILKKWMTKKKRLRQRPPD